MRSIGIVFPVKDGTTMRMAGLFGGSILIPTRIPDDGLRQYTKSIEHWRDASNALNVVGSYRADAVTASTAGT